MQKLSGSQQSLFKCVSSPTLSDKQMKFDDADTSDIAAHSLRWEAPKIVAVVREPDSVGLGISIVGGRGESGARSGGIFIKNIMPNSPAARSGSLKRGDRILAVCGVDLQDATHDDAVEVIKNAPREIEFLIQSVLPTADVDQLEMSVANDSLLVDSSVPASATLAAVPSVTTDEDTANDYTRSEESSPSRATEGASVSLCPPVLEAWPIPRTPTPEVIQEGLRDDQTVDIQEKIEAFKSKLAVEFSRPQVTTVAPRARRLSSSDLEEEDEEEEDVACFDERTTQGIIINKHGHEVRDATHC